MNISAIVPSAGTGRRMKHGLKKPYISLRGLPVLAHTLKVLNRVSIFCQIIIPVFPGEENFCQKKVVEKITLSTETIIVPGGDTRQESVRKSLEFLQDSCDMVLVHDGARPLVSNAAVDNVIEAAKIKRAATAAVPVKDTVSMVSEADHTIIKTLPRGSLYSIQTPQAFEKDLIVNAHNKALEDGFRGTDDASLVERLGISVAVITGSYANIKVTTQEDLLFAEQILRYSDDTGRQQ